MKTRCVLAGALLALLPLTSATSGTSGWDPKEKETAKQQTVVNPEVTQAIADFKNKTPGLKRSFDGAYGYAVFPTVGKAGIGIGGAR